MWDCTVIFYSFSPPQIETWLLQDSDLNANWHRCSAASFLYRDITRTIWQSAESSPLMQRCVPQMNCAYRCKVNQIDCNVLEICLHLWITHNYLQTFANVRVIVVSPVWVAVIWRLVVSHQDTNAIALWFKKLPPRDWVCNAYNLWATSWSLHLLAIGHRMW